MSDLIKRLRMGTQVPEFELRQEAADALEARDAKIDRLNGALARADAKCVKLTGDIQVLKLQRDATHVSRCPNCGDGDWWFNE